MDQNKMMLNNEEAAGILPVAANTLRNSRSTGILCGRKAPPFMKIGNRVYYLRADLEEWLGGFTKYNNTSEFALEGGDE